MVSLSTSGSGVTVVKKFHRGHSKGVGTVREAVVRTPDGWGSRGLNLGRTGVTDPLKVTKGWYSTGQLGPYRAPTHVGPSKQGWGSEMNSSSYYKNENLEE